ncbi:MAG TPA: PEP-CTERM sorting domain-containing protein [Oligoflexia bacterium]|nr:PEP-CTERM sorting domain-containing protein [Oligoflexia bacterium]
MSRAKFVVALCALVFGVAGSANAITFDLTQPVSYTWAPSIQIWDTTGTYMLTATGLVSGSNRNVVRSSSGIGVWSGSILEDPEVDGLGDDETLVLDLGLAQLMLESITFTRVGLDDDFRLIVDSVVQIASADIPGGNILGTSVSVYQVLPQLLGSVFSLTVPNWNDDYKVSQVTFSGSVPEPMTLALFGVGLVGLGLRKRARRA